jgi:hypothetical protein
VVGPTLLHEAIDRVVLELLRGHDLQVHRIELDERIRALGEVVVQLCLLHVPAPLEHACEPGVNVGPERVVGVHRDVRVTRHVAGLVCENRPEPGLGRLELAQMLERQGDLCTRELRRGDLWGAEIRFSCREPVFVDQSAKSISSLDAV